MGDWKGAGRCAHRLFAIVVTGAVLSGCSSDKPATQTPTKTQAQRDSAIGKSGLPGSQGVLKALGAADSARAHQAAIDSIKP